MKAIFTILGVIAVSVVICVSAWETRAEQREGLVVHTVTVSAPHTVVGIQEVMPLTVVAMDANGDTIDGLTATWRSSNDSVATVNADGLLTPVAEGATIIAATVGGKAGEVEVTVVWSASDVDFAQTTPVKSMSGLLHGLNSVGLPTPDDSLISPLAPKLWRTTPNVVPTARARGLGARYELLLSDMWNYPLNGWPNGRPWVDTVRFDSLIRSTARLLGGQIDVWEIWNEPDPTFNTKFWDGTEQQFFETYLRAYNILRAELGPDALIAGPSITHYDQEYLDRFAAFCIANGCEANVLTWHELGGFHPIQGIEDDLANARARFINGSANGALNVREIHINEYNSPYEIYSPASSLLYIQYLERGGADAAARSCWSDSSGISDCFNNSLDGLLEPDGFQPRSVWWAYRLYAQGVDGRVCGDAQRRQVLCLASVLTPSSQALPGNAIAQVLTGVADVDGGPSGVALGIRLAGVNALSGLQSATKIRVQLFRVSPSGTEGTSTAPELVSDQQYDLDGGKTNIILAATLQNAVYQVALLSVP